MRTRAVSVLAVGLALLPSGGCGEILEYPEVQPEQGSALCQNGIDDDLDDTTDCDDIDCLGSCSEETPAECSDGRDNDGDGLIDAADPRCWLARPPTAQRCAKAPGAEVVNHFDTMPVRLGIDENQGVYHSEWASWGFDGTRPVVGSAPRLGPERSDLLLSFEGNTTGSGTLDQNLGSYVRQLPFSGNLRNFELSFDAYVPPKSILRAGIVPVGLAPSTLPPIAGAETALLSVGIDASVPPTLVLIVEGIVSVSPLPYAAPRPDEERCDGTTEDCMGRITVSIDEGDVLATFTDASGVSTEARSPEPVAWRGEWFSSLSLPPSRLVLWGGSVEGAPGARLDDLYLRVAPELPCGFLAPQIPGANCLAPWNSGYTVSLARSAEGEHCALVTWSDWDPVEQRLSPPRGLTAWSSPDGDNWTPAAEISSPETGATIVGAGATADDLGLHAVLAVRNEESGTVRLAFVDGAGCGQWGSAELGPALPDDAEAPSYVIARGRHEAYFTRPPAGGVGRRLWRVARDAPDADAELITELPNGVEAPVSLQLVGARDVVLAAPSRAGSGGRGVSLFVADHDLKNFRPAGEGPVLALPPSPDLPSGEGKLGFDDREVLSAALALHDEHGYILYGGRSTEGAFHSGEGGTPVLAVGTARLLFHGEDKPDTAIVPEENCGNGACEPDEDCLRCAADCPCGGNEIASDVLLSEEPWESFSSDPNPRAILYRGTNPPGMNFAGGEPTWLALRLEHPITGDFELAFDALVENADIDGGLVYVGLGTEPLDEASGPAPESGVFARVAACVWLSTFSPLAVANGFPFQGDGEDDTLPAAPLSNCWVTTSQVLGAWQHVVLARRGNRVSIGTQENAWLVAAQERPMCGTANTAVTYAGALPPLTHILIGFGGGAFEGSVRDAHPGTIANLELRSLDDPEQCPPPKERCDRGSEEPTCVDTSQSPEHCGGCGRRCGTFETCVQGACVCGSRANAPGILECDAACIDPRASLDHCGACDSACNERCLTGVCDPIETGSCESPFEIPSGGGDLNLYFPSLVDEARKIDCGKDGQIDFVNEIIGQWTPAQTGTARVHVDVSHYEASGAYLLDSVVWVTQGTACDTLIGCDDDIVLYEIISSELSFPAVAGRAYQIHVALWNYRPPDPQFVKLSVEFEP